MTKTDIQITRFEDGNYWIDIVDEGENYHAWLFHKDIAEAMFMFGEPKEQSNGEKTSFEEFCERVEDNLPEEKLYFINENWERAPWIIDG